MARLPFTRKPPSKSQQAIDTVTNLARIYVIVKGTAAATKAAEGGAKAYGTAKAVKVGGRSVVKLLVVPVAAVGGVVVWRKVRGGGSTESERPLGPVATPEAVSPPGTASGPSSEETASPVADTLADAGAPREAAASDSAEAKVAEARNGASPESSPAAVDQDAADEGTAS